MTPIYITKNSDLITMVEEFITEWHSSSEFIIVKTSGSTGTPKSIKLNKEYMAASAQATGKFLNLKPSNTALLSMSPKAIGGMMMIVRYIVLDLNLIVVDPSSAPLLDISMNINFAAMVPLQLKESIKNTKEKLNQIGTLIIGGGPIEKSLESQIKELNPQVYHTYGMTETISHIALRNVSNGDNFFKTLPGVEISLVNDCLNITSISIGVHKLQTNDIVDLISENSFVWKGRSDLAINSGGIKIIPAIIESKLSELIEENFISVGLDDETFGQKHVIIIETEANLVFTKDQFDFIEKFKRPKEIYLLKEFVRTESGKIDRIKTLGMISNAKKQVL